MRGPRLWIAGTLAAACWSAASVARADGDIVIRLEGQRPAAEQTAKATLPAPQPVAATTAPAPQPTLAPPALSYGQLGKVKSGPASIRRQPKSGGHVLSRATDGQHLVVRGTSGGWYAVLMQDGTLGFIPQSNVELQEYVVTQVAAAPPVPQANATLADGVIREAYRYLGTKYVWGGNGFSGVDCSGLVKNCFKQNGINLPRTAGMQERHGYDVPLSQLQPGDRLYFSVKKRNDHTGIYLGNGYFIHASSSRGEVGVDHLSKALYGTNITSARRF